MSKASGNMKSCRLRAFAKINLYLRVVGRRPDGFHDLDSFFLQIDLADELFFEIIEAPGLQLSCNWPTVPLDEKNLCARAYTLVMQQVGQHVGIRLQLDKKIPMGAGMGGGSSDAAVTLMALNHLCESRLSPAELFAMAQKLGSDVPFFLYGGLCHAAGRGELLSPCKQLPSFYVLVVIPGIEISTQLVYQNLKIGLTPTNENTIFADLNFDAKRFYEQYPRGRNDLEPWVLQQFPVIDHIKEQLLQRGAWGACMTGSGSAVFGLFDDLASATRAQTSFTADYAAYIARPVQYGLHEVNEFLR